MSLTKVSYSMLNGGPYNVLDFGADPTGSTDNSAVFQAAIDAIVATGIPSVLKLPILPKINIKINMVNKGCIKYHNGPSNVCL
jgi:hypothetical protein